MNATDVIGYTGDADTYCVPCARARYSGHYHIMNGQPGCMPDQNLVAQLPADAIEVFRTEWEFILDSVNPDEDEGDWGWPEIGNIPPEAADKGFLVARNDGMYYLELSACDMAECLTPRGFWGFTDEDGSSPIVDGEGNDVHPIFCGAEFDYVATCGDCGEVLEGAVNLSETES